MKSRCAIFGFLILVLSSSIGCVSFVRAAPRPPSSPPQTITRGGITCTVVTGGPYPQNGHIFQATSSTRCNTEIKARPTSIMKGYWGHYIKEKFEKASVDFFAFEDAIAAETFFQNKVLEPEIKEKLLKDYQAWGGYSEKPVSGGFSDNRRVVLFRNVVSADDINVMHEQNRTDYSHTIGHEMGHVFDRLSGNPSKSTEFKRVARVDQDYMKERTAGKKPPHDYVSIMDRYKHWLNENKRYELFAEVFAKFVHGTAGTEPASGADVVIEAYYDCSSRFVKWYLLMDQPPRRGTNDYDCQRCQ